MNRMAKHMVDHLNILSAVGLGICVLQLFGIIFACMLYVKLKKMNVNKESESALIAAK